VKAPNASATSLIFYVNYFGTIKTGTVALT